MKPGIIKPMRQHEIENILYEPGIGQNMRKPMHQLPMVG
jgi:hypothetical protein